MTDLNRLKVVLVEKMRSVQLSEKMERNLGIVLRWMTNKIHPSVEQLYEKAHLFYVDVKELFFLS